MNAHNVFKRRLASMNGQIKDKDAEYVRVEVQGIEVLQIQKYKNDDQTIEIVGFDENNNETVLICPLGHFSARLSFAPKNQQKKQIGFKIEASGEAEKLM